MLKRILNKVNQDVFQAVFICNHLELHQPGFQFIGDVDIFELDLLVEEFLHLGEAVVDAELRAVQLQLLSLLYRGKVQNLADLAIENLHVYVDAADCSGEFARICRRLHHVQVQLDAVQRRLQVMADAFQHFRLVVFQLANLDFPVLGRHVVEYKEN